ncbi:MAG: hypothetical protein AAGF73_04565 [Actinomycetota bacterium]
MRVSARGRARIDTDVFRLLAVVCTQETGVDGCLEGATSSAMFFHDVLLGELDRVREID